MKTMNNLLEKCYRLIKKKQNSRIEITESVLSGNGSFVDIRYWLTCPNENSTSFSILLIEEETGKRLGLMRMPKYGLVKTKHRGNQKTGLLLFYNNKNTVKPGSKVTLVYGPHVVEHIEVK